MEEFVYVEGKKYRRGYTTGSCATGAAKAAATMLLMQKTVEVVPIDTPKGIPLVLKVHEPLVTPDYAECAIQKDGGDDQDATHGMMIYARVRWTDGKGITLLGGRGIGKVTQKGLGLPIGEAAINKTPQAMITSEVSKVVGDRGIEIMIYAPEGEEIAKQTFNPRLGIEGGISIIGTTGIVEPMSDEGWKRSLSIELEMKKAQGLEQIILVPGNHGERFVKDQLEIDERYVTRMSNFVGYMLMECKRIGYKKILLAGHLGKFIKLAAGIFHTHSKVADARSEIMVANLALMGASRKVLEKVACCSTTEAALDIIEQEGLQEVYALLAQKCKERCQMHLNDASIQVEVILFSMSGEELSRSSQTKELLEVFR